MTTLDFYLNLYDWSKSEAIQCVQMCGFPLNIRRICFKINNNNNADNKYDNDTENSDIIVNNIDHNNNRFLQKYFIYNFTRLKRQSNISTQNKKKVAMQSLLKKICKMQF